jgi:hypothetical protein
VSVKTHKTHIFPRKASLPLMGGGDAIKDHINSGWLLDMRFHRLLCASSVLTTFLFPGFDYFKSCVLLATVSPQSWQVAGRCLQHCLPVMDALRLVIAAVGISSPAARFHKNFNNDSYQAVAAMVISHTLGGQEPMSAFSRIGLKAPNTQQCYRLLSSTF